MSSSTDTRRLLVASAARAGLVGAAVAVVRPGESPVFECLGVTDSRSDRPVTPATVFRIASISKTMTAIAVMQLRDEGRVDLDEPVNRYLTAFTVEVPAGAPDVTVRHLLTHTSGIGEAPSVRDLVNRRAWGAGRPDDAPADLGVIYRGTLRTGVPAGSKWAYANHGFAALGQVVEDVSGEPFASYAQRHVFAPLGMDSTGYVRNERIAAGLASGSHWIFGRFGWQKDYELTLLAPGSVMSSLEDMARYTEWLLTGGSTAPEVLKTDTLAEMLSPQYAVHPGFPGMGLAFWLDHDGDHRTAGHDGNVPGFASSLLIAPDDEVGVVVLTNTATMLGAHVLASELLRARLRDARSASVTTEAEVVPERPDVWPGLVGDYAPAPGFLTNVRALQMFGGEVQIAVRNRRLVLRALSPLPEVRRGLELHAVDVDDPMRFAAEVQGVTIPVAFDREAGGGEATSVAVGPPSNVVFHRRTRLRSIRVRRRVAAAVAASLLARRMSRRRRRRRA